MVMCAASPVHEPTRLIATIEAFSPPKLEMKISAGLIIVAIAITAVHADSVDSACPDLCPDVMDPVYDDTGAMYSNECYMRAAKCQHKKPDVNLLEEYERVYGKKFGDDSQRALFGLEDDVATQGAKCGGICPAVYSPVFDDEGNQYSNKCVMNSQKNCKGNKTGGEDILAEYKRLYGKDFGASRDESSSEENTTQEDASASSESGSDEDVPTFVKSTKSASREESGEDSTDGSDETYCPNVICPMVFNPVYDAEGNEYSNECAMNAAKCKGKRKNVDVLEEYKRIYGKSFGASRDEDDSGSEESGSSSAATKVVKSAKGPSKAAKKSAPSSSDIGSLYDDGSDGIIGSDSDDSLQSTKCASGCPDVMLRVCGSDGVMYQNPCELRLAACKAPALNLIEAETDACSSQTAQEKEFSGKTHVIVN